MMALSSLGIMQQDNSEQVIIDPKLIAKHYIRTWFFLDLLSSIPLDYIFLIFNVGQNEVKLWKYRRATIKGYHLRLFPTG